MEDQLALFIRWRIFFSSVLGVAQRHEQLLRKSLGTHLQACFRPGAEAR
jgi:hypothetical protein